MKIYKIILIFCALTCYFNSSLDGEVIRRAAFDFGSGKIKLQVADVDTDTHSIVASIYNADTIVLLSEDAGKNPQGAFSEEIQAQALAAASNFKQKALELGAVEFRGLATEAYRKAPNAQELVDRYSSELGIPVRIIAQEEEGKNGFLALVAENHFDTTQVISWDIGGGSFQVTYMDDNKDIQVYMAPYGRITTKNAIIANIKRENPSDTLSPNPMNNAEWESSVDYFDTVLPSVPRSLTNKLKRGDVKLIGISAHPEKLRDLKTYSMHDLTAILKDRLNKTDSELASSNKAPMTAVSELVLVYSIMKKLNVSTVDYIRTSSGSTSALLIQEEYWNN